MIRHAKSVAELIRFNFVHFLCTSKLFFKSEKAGSREGRVDKKLRVDKNTGNCVSCFFITGPHSGTV